MKRNAGHNYHESEKWHNFPFSVAFRLFDVLGNPFVEQLVGFRMQLEPLTGSIIQLGALLKEHQGHPGQLFMRYEVVR